MKNKTNFIKKTLILSVVIFTQISFAQSKKVAAIESIDNITISKEHVANYINKFLSSEKMSINELKIEKNNDNYILLAKGFNNSWTYIIPLKKKGNHLHIHKNKTLNACEAKEMNIDNYVFKDGGIIHCKDCNHKIMAR